MHKPTIISSLLMLACTSSAMAQYDQDISVEGRYVPEYILRDRIGQFPLPVRPEIETSALNYSLQGVTANFTPHAIPATATGWNDTRRWCDHRGYLDLGLGMWLQSNLSAGYRIIDTQASLFGVRLQHNSTSLWRPDLAQSVSHTRMERYDDSLGIYGAHDFGAGSLSASADWHLGYYNYYGFNPLPNLEVGENQNINAPSQTLNDVAARVEWVSDRSSQTVLYDAGISARYFGMRRLYLPDSSNQMVPLAYTGGRETDLGLTASVRGITSSCSSIGLDLEGHMMLASDYVSRSKSMLLPTMKAPEDYGVLALTPYYRYSKGNLDLRAGLRLDLVMNARDAQGVRYETFRIAPDFKLEYASRVVSLYMRAGGGVAPNTLASNYEQDYYLTPAIFSAKPAYSPIDALLGVRVGPLAGFHVGAEVKYRVTFGQRFFGWYQTVLNQPQPTYARGADYTIRGISAGVNMGYDAGRYFKIDMEGTYQPQSGEKGYYNGMDRPRWKASATAQSNPWSTLKFKLGFDFRGLRKFPLLAVPSSPGVATDPEAFIVMHKVPHWVSLNFGAAYDVNDSVGIWLQADNLTNRRNVLAPGLPTPGITVTAGVSLLF